jgi:hypothetical protein
MMASNLDRSAIAELTGVLTGGGGGGGGRGRAKAGIAGARRTGAATNLGTD